MSRTPHRGIWQKHANEIQIKFLFTSFSVMNYIHNSEFTHIFITRIIYMFFASQSSCSWWPTRTLITVWPVATVHTLRKWRAIFRALKMDIFIFACGSASPLTFSFFAKKKKNTKNMHFIRFCARFILNSSDGFFSACQRNFGHYLPCEFVQLQLRVWHAHRESVVAATRG